jgi:hypothetical protein
MRNLFLVGWLCLSITAILFLSCQKEANVESDELPALQTSITVSEAKVWFANGPVLREKKILSLPFNVLPEKSSQRMFARMGKLEAKLQWDNTKHYKRDGLDYLIVPVTLNAKIFGKEYDFAKVVIFNKNHSGEMKASVLEILSKKGTSLSGRQMEVAATAFYNRELNKKDLLTGINAFVFFYDETYKKQTGFEVINGTWAVTKTTLTVGKNNQSTVADNYTESGNCELWGLFLDTYDANGVLLYSELLYTYWVGADCNNEGGGPVVDPNESGDPSGSGGGSGSGGSYMDEDGDEYFTRQGTFQNVVYVINAADGGGTCKTIQHLYARFYSNRPEKDKITHCYLIKSDIYNNTFGATSNVSNYNVSNLHTNTISAVTTGRVQYPNGVVLPFTNTTSIQIGYVGWHL